MTAITTAIRADAATSDAEGRRDLAGHLADFRAALLDEAALIAASDRASHALEVAGLTATRDIVIGQRETAQRERDEARGLLGALTADLNATREKLTTAEAFRDSLEREVDGINSERSELLSASVGVAQALDDGGSLGPAGGERDPRAWVTFARGLADRVKASRLDGRATTIAVASEQGSEIAALRAEVAELRARPVLTVDMAERVISTYCDEFAATDREGRTDVWSEVDQSRRDHAIGVMKSTIAKLGAVALPAQDRAEDLASSLGGIYSADHVRAVLASLGAPEVTPPATVAASTPDETRSALLEAIHIISHFPTTQLADEAVERFKAIASRPTTVTTPSKPADVFAGVSLREIGAVAIQAGNHHADGLESGQEAVGRAVLDALRVTLVAPVDPEEVARGYHDDKSGPSDVIVPHWGALNLNARAAARSAMRATLTARGIPVTPEAGK